MTFLDCFSTDGSFWKQHTVLYKKKFGLLQELILKDPRVSVIEIFSQMQNLPNIETLPKVSTKRQGTKPVYDFLKRD